MQSWDNRLGVLLSSIVSQDSLKSIIIGLVMQGFRVHWFVAWEGRRVRVSLFCFDWIFGFFDREREHSVLFTFVFLPVAPCELLCPVLYTVILGSCNALMSLILRWHANALSIIMLAQCKLSETLTKSGPNFLRGWLIIVSRFCRS